MAKPLKGLGNLDVRNGFPDFQEALGPILKAFETGRSPSQ
jgi:hypothetical protein